MSDVATEERSGVEEQSDKEVPKKQSRFRYQDSALEAKHLILPPWWYHQT